MNEIRKSKGNNGEYFDDTLRVNSRETIALLENCE